MARAMSAQVKPDTATASAGASYPKSDAVDPPAVLAHKFKRTLVPLM